MGLLSEVTVEDIGWYEFIDGQLCLVCPTCTDGKCGWWRDIRIPKLGCDCASCHLKDLWNTPIYCDSCDSANVVFEGLCGRCADTRYG